MTAKTFRSLGKYVADIANEMGLRGWSIVVHEREPGEDNSASTECVYARRIAHLCFGETFLHSPPEEQRIVVIHELLHVQLWMTDQAVRDSIEALGREARETAWTHFNTTREYAVDAIATAIADKFPLWEG